MIACNEFSYIYIIDMFFKYSSFIYLQHGKEISVNKMKKVDHKIHYSILQSREDAYKIIALILGMAFDWKFMATKMKDTIVVVQNHLPKHILWSHSLSIVCELTFSFSFSFQLRFFYAKAYFMFSLPFVYIHQIRAP